MPQGVSVDGNTYSYICPISETQELSVMVTVEEGGAYSIRCWQAVSTTVWEEDLTLDVWDGMIIE